MRINQSERSNIRFAKGLSSGYVTSKMCVCENSNFMVFAGKCLELFLIANRSTFVYQLA